MISIAKKNNVDFKAAYVWIVLHGEPLRSMEIRGESMLYISGQQSFFAVLGVYSAILRVISFIPVLKLIDPAMR